MGEVANSDWANFSVAQVGAAAALTGLVIVAVSINLSRILAFPTLPGRAVEALAMLVGVLVVSSMALVPGQPGWLLGVEVLAVGLAMCLIPAVIVMHSFGQLRAQRHTRLWVRVLVGQISGVPIVVGGISLIGGGSGLYWVVPGVILSLVGGVVSAWVLLVEILR